MSLEQFIERLNVNEETKGLLRDYAGFNSFDYRVKKLVYEGVVEEAAQEKVIMEYVKEITREV